MDRRVLVIAHRREILMDLDKRIAAACGLKAWEHGVEMGEYRAPLTARVVCGGIDTLRSEKRFLGVFGAIITDECHRAAAPSYTQVYERYGVNRGECWHFGFTATAKRTDKQALYAVKLDGDPVMIEDKKTKTTRPADPTESVYQVHAYEKSILDGINEGWLVPVIGHSVQTDTDLSDIGTVAGDFNQGQLTKAVGVENVIRNNQAVAAWKQLAEGRPTIVFCQGVAHAHHVADMWRQAGYTAAALDGETDEVTRLATLTAFQNGRLTVLCNDCLFTEGMDAPICSCVVHLGPTKSWNRYVQRTGRGLRTLPGIVDATPSLEQATCRRDAIAASGKPNCLVIDLVDVCKDNDLCTVPSILDMPAKLNLQGQSLTKAAAMLTEYADAALHLEDEGKAPPATYQELQVRLEQVELIRNSGHPEAIQWIATDAGFRYKGVPPGYTAELLPATDNPNAYRLQVKYMGQEIENKAGAPREKFKVYMEHAAKHAQMAAEAHRETLTPRSRGTLARLSEKQIYVLHRLGHSDPQIDSYPYAKAKAILDKHFEARKAQREGAAV
jgi:superfamily II DNA or RNA helicase